MGLNFFCCPVLSWLYFFLATPPRSNPWTDFSHLWLKWRVVTQGCAFWGFGWRPTILRGSTPCKKTQKGGVVRHFHKIVISPNSKWRTAAILPNVENAITRLSINWFGWNLGGRIPSCPRHVPMMRLPWQRPLPAAAMATAIVHLAVMVIWRPNAWTNFDEIWYTTAS